MLRGTALAFLTSIAISGAVLTCVPASAQVAGSTTIGLQVEQVQLVATGWSVRKQILGKSLINGAGEKVGRIDDLIVAPGSTVSVVIVGAGGFVGLARHDVAIPVDQITADGDNFVLAGATKAAIKALPAFEYAR